MAVTVASPLSVLFLLVWCGIFRVGALRAKTKAVRIAARQPLEVSTDYISSYMDTLDAFTRVSTPAVSSVLPANLPDATSAPSVDTPAKPDIASTPGAGAIAGTLSPEAAADADAPRRQVVVAKFDEDVSWLERLPKNYDVVVYQSHDSNGTNFVENYGNEASKYLQYIVDHYDDMPEDVVFVQAGRQDWHDPLPKDVSLSRWNWGAAAESGGLASLPTAAPCLVEDSVELPLQQIVSGSQEVQRQNPNCVNGVKEHMPKQMATLKQVWANVFQDELGPLPQRWLTHCCAQFEVTRSAVHRHRKAFYESLLEWVVAHDRELLADDMEGEIRRNHDPERRDAGHVLEVTWALLFSDPALPDLPVSVDQSFL